MNTQPTKSKAVVVYSGGLDSTVTLYTALQYHEVYPISFYYGQRHARELQMAQEVSRLLHLHHELVDISNIVNLISNSSLTNPSIEVPEGHYSAENMKLTVVPNRNAIMLSIAFGYAANIGAESVFCGVHAGDHAIYPDCRPEFIYMFNQMEDTALEREVRLIVPFILSSKADIVTAGSELQVPFSLTYSCYKGGEQHCGRCGTCVERREAFHLAGVKDPTVYTDPDFWKAVTQDA